MRALTTAVVVVLAWGVFAFGAVYPWAYWPLLAACGVIGLLGCLWPMRAGSRRVNAPVLAGLLLVGSATSLQLVAIPRRTLARISPVTHTFLNRFDLPYAFASATAHAEGPACEGVMRDDVAPAHALSVRPESTRRSLVFLAALGALLIGVASILSSRTAHATDLARGLIVLAAAVAFVGLVQKASFGETIYGFWRPQFKGAVFGPFVNRNHFAGWMMMAAPVAVGYLCGVVDRRRRRIGSGWHGLLRWLASSEANHVVLVALAILVMGLSIVLTNSRSGLVCFTLSLIAMGWLVRRDSRTGRRGRAILWYLIVLPVAIVAWVGIDAALYRFGAEDAGLSGRMALWSETIGVIKEFPLTGAGLNTFGTTMLFYETADPDYRYSAAHNDYLQVAAEGGLLVGLPAALLAMAIAREIRRRFREARDTRATYWLRVGATLGIIAVALQTLVEFSLQIPANAMLFAVMCAIAIHHSPPDGSHY